MNDRFRLSKPPKLKSNPLSQFSTPLSRSDRSDRNSFSQQLQQFTDNNPNKVDSESFQAKYERAIKLINQNDDISAKKALNILQYLSQQILKMQQDHQISYDFLEKVVINCWRLKNRYKELDEANRRQPLYFIRHFVQYFQQYYRKHQIHKNGLEMLYLIQANQQYEQKMYKEGLQSCDLSLKYCKGAKAHPHLLKVHYLKTRIYASLKNVDEQLSQIKKCILYLNTLTSSNYSDANQKEYIANLKQILVQRKQKILQLTSDKKKSLDFSRKQSVHKFRKRSISLKKQSSEKDISLKKAKQQPAKFQGIPKKHTLNTKSASHSKHQSMTDDDRQKFIPIEINKFQSKNKLKKKVLKLSPQHLFPPQEMAANVMDEIQFVPPPIFNHEQLMLRRPKFKKDEVKEEIVNKVDEVKDEDPEQPKQLSLQRKLTSFEQKQEIEPVTHLINQINHMEHEDTSEGEMEQLIRDCVKKTQQNILKQYLKRNFCQQFQSEQKIQEKDSNSSISPQSMLNINTEIALNHAQSNHDEVIYQNSIYLNKDINVDDNTQLCISYGILSNFQFAIKLQKNQHTNVNGECYKTLFLNFKATLNQQWKINAVIQYPFFNSLDKNIQNIVDQIFSKQNPGLLLDDQNLSYKVFSLISNQLLMMKKPNGLVLVQKNSNLFDKQNQSTESTQSYQNYLRDRLLIYQMNNFTQQYMKQEKSQHFLAEKKQKQQIKNVQTQKQQKTQENINYLASEDILNYYLPRLISRMTEEQKEEYSSMSSIKRFKTQKFYKDTIFSYKSTIKSLEQSDYNAHLKHQNTKSLSLAIMPQDFNSKISNFFQHWQDVKETSHTQFYYCMKFLLIKPPSMHYNDTLNNFYDKLQVEHLHKLRHNCHVIIRMSCYRMKDIFRKCEKSQVFYKFQIQFKGEKIKMMKFIATSEDIKLVYIHFKTEKSSRDFDKNLKNSRKLFSSRANLSKESTDSALNQSFMLKLLKHISPNIFVKKDYIYSIIGFETEDPYFNFINKFKLEGKTVQNKNFMIPHLKYIHIMLQKSIKINCDYFKQFAVLTIRQIQKSVQFNIIFYIPKMRKTYSINMQRNIITYLSKQDLEYIFKNKEMSIIQIQYQLFNNFKKIEQKQDQGLIWNRFANLFKFQPLFSEDKINIVLKIGAFTAFLKNSSYSEYFELQKKIFHLQMSVSKKNHLLKSEADPKSKTKTFVKKISTQKQLPSFSNNKCQSQIKQNKRSGRVLKPSIRKRVQQAGFRKLEVFDELNKFYESDAHKYIIYLSLTQLLQINEEEEEIQSIKQTKKLNYSFYLSDLIGLLRESKKQLFPNDQKQTQNQNQFKDQIFTFAILLRAMTIIKYRLIEQLKKISIKMLFEGQNTIKNQKLFKNNLNRSFNYLSENIYSLNTSKKLHKYESNIFLIHKNIFNQKRNTIVSVFYDEKLKQITFFITNNNELYDRQKFIYIKDMHFPWIQFFKKQHLFKINDRLYLYYKNILFFI